MFPFVPYKGFLSVNRIPTIEGFHVPASAKPLSGLTQTAPNGCPSAPSGKTQNPVRSVVVRIKSVFDSTIPFDT
jgi:hypothetical protein